MIFFFCHKGVVCVLPQCAARQRCLPFFTQHILLQSGLSLLPYLRFPVSVCAHSAVDTSVSGTYHWLCFAHTEASNQLPLSPPSVSTASNDGLRIALRAQEEDKSKDGWTKWQALCNYRINARTTRSVNRNWQMSLQQQEQTYVVGELLGKIKKHTHIRSWTMWSSGTSRSRKLCACTQCSENSFEGWKYSSWMPYVLIITHRSVLTSDCDPSTSGSVRDKTVAICWTDQK